MRVLIINIARLGDIVQTGPLAAALEAQGDEVSLLVSDAFTDAAGGLPAVKRVFGFPLGAVVAPLLTGSGGLKASLEALKVIIKDLQCERFDRVINITHTDFSAVLTALVGSPEVSGITLDCEGCRVVHGAWANYYFNSCITRSFNRFNLVDLHCQVGGVKAGGRLSFNLPDLTHRRADEFIRDLGLSGRRLVGLVPGASTPQKAWPATSFAAAANRLHRMAGAAFVVFGSRGDAPLGDEIARSCPQAVNICGQTELSLLAAMLARCELVISNDTGPMHIAAAVGTRVLDISLGSALAHETAPYGAGHFVIESRIACHPCHPRLKCEHRSCQTTVPADLVADLALKIINNDLIDIAVNEERFHGINLYRTDFDRDGWWRLEPLLRRPAVESDILSLALREMWKHSLAGGGAWREAYRSIGEAVGRDFAATAAVGGDPVLGGGLFPTIDRLRRLGRDGLRAAEELAHLAPDAGNLERIRALGDDLREVDAAIVQTAHRTPVLMPLAAQFIGGKDQLQGWDLSRLAAGTAELYRGLEEWSAALPLWVEAIMKGIADHTASEAA